MKEKTVSDYIFDYYLNGTTVVIENGQVVVFEESK